MTDAVSPAQSAKQLIEEMHDLLTILRERTVAAGVTKRESRAAEAKEKLAAGFGNM